MESLFEKRTWFYSCPAPFGCKIKVMVVQPFTTNTIQLYNHTRARFATSFNMEWFMYKPKRTLPLVKSTLVFTLIKVVK